MANELAYFVAGFVVGVLYAGFMAVFAIHGGIPRKKKEGEA